MLFNRARLPETEIHHVLSSPRRRETLTHLWRATGTVSVRELSEAVATAETGLDPAPRATRESVYNSLHQTHLPKLHELGLVRYDSDRKEIEVLSGARDIELYMDVVTKYGVTWGEYYRALGVTGLFLTLASTASVPVVSVVDPLVWGSAFLAAFSVSTMHQLWKSRYHILRSFRG